MDKRVQETISAVGKREKYEQASG